MLSAGYMDIAAGKDLLAPLCVGKLKMIVEKVFLVPRILFHTFVILNRLEDDLTETIEVGDIHHLGVKEMRHKVSCTGLIVYLVSRLAESHKVQGTRFATNLGPSSDSVLHHQILCHWNRDVDHVVSIGFLAHSWLAITADCQTKKLATRLVRRSKRLLGFWSG